MTLLKIVALAIAAPVLAGAALGAWLHHFRDRAQARAVELQALRWTDANPEKVWRLQPFGGRTIEMGRHDGFLIPTRVELGNMYGTPGYAPFFLATVTKAEF